MTSHRASLIGSPLIPMTAALFILAGAYGIGGIWFAVLAFGLLALAGWFAIIAIEAALDMLDAVNRSDDA